MEFTRRARSLQEARLEVERLEKEVRASIPTHIWMNAALDQERFLTMFKDAHFPPGYITAIRNGYWGETCELSALPWYEYRCEIGTVSIGWRKRVISIAWEAIPGRLAPIEVEDNVTKGTNFIHAWGLEKALEYLGKIRNALLEAHRGQA